MNREKGFVQVFFIQVYGVNFTFKVNKFIFREALIDVFSCLPTVAHVYCSRI